MKKKIWALCATLLVTCGLAALGDTRYTAPQFGGTVWTWNKDTSLFDADGQTSVASPTRANNKGPVYKFVDVGTVTSTAGSGVDTSDSGGVIVSNSTVTTSIGRWAGSVLVGPNATVNVGYSVSLKGTEPDTAATVYVDGTMNLTGRTDLNLDDGNNQRWYIGKDGKINLSGITSVTKGSRTWDLQAVLTAADIAAVEAITDDPEIAGAVNRTRSAAVLAPDTPRVLISTAGGATVLSNIDTATFFNESGTTLSTPQLTVSGNDLVAGKSAQHYTAMALSKDSDVTWTAGGTATATLFNDSSSTATTFVNGDAVTFSGGTATLATDIEVSSLTTTGATTITGQDHTITIDGTFDVGGDTTLGAMTTAAQILLRSAATLTIGSGANLTSDQLRIGEQSQGFVTVDGGTLTITGTNTSNDGNNSFLLAHWSAASGSKLTLNSGTIVAGDSIMRLSMDGDGNYEQNSGTASVKGINFAVRWASGNNTVVLNGGTLNVGSAGITQITKAGSLTLAGGTLKSSASFTVSAGTSGSAAISGDTTIDVTGDDVVTISAPLTGSGTITKTGTGTLVLSGINTNFTGSVEVQEGALAVESAKALGEANVNVTATGTLVLQNYEQSLEKVTFATGSKLSFIESVAGTVTIQKNFTGTPTYEVMRADFVTPVSDYAKNETDTTITFTFNPQVSGKICWYDYTFTNTITSVGEMTTTLGYDNAPTYTTTKPISLYAKALVYTSPSYPDTVSAAIYCNVPTVTNAVLIGFGTISGGTIALAAGDPAQNEVYMWYVAPGGASKTQLAKMTVPNATTTKHLYIFTKSTDGIKIYLDGALVASAANQTIGNGLQVGSIHGGIGSCGLLRLDNTAVADTTSTVAALRLYKSALGQNAVNALKTEFPYVSPNGTYQRSVGGTVDFNATDAWTYKKTGAEDTKADEPAKDCGVSLTTLAAAEMTMNGSADIAAEALTVSGNGAITFKTGDHILSAASATFSVAVTNQYGALDLTGATMNFTSGGSYHADWSKYPATSIFATTFVPVTGICTATDPVTATLPAGDAARTVGALRYDAATSKWGFDVTITDAALVVTVEGATTNWTWNGISVTPDWTTWGGTNIVKRGTGAITLVQRGNCFYTVEAGTLMFSAKSSAQSTITVKTDATFDMNGLSGGNGFKLVLDGGTLANTGATISYYNSQIASLMLTADSYLNVVHNMGLVSGSYGATPIIADLGGHTLTATIDTGNVAFHACNTLLTNGTFAVTSGYVEFCQSNSVDTAGITLAAAAAIRVNSGISTTLNITSAETGSKIDNDGSLTSLALAAGTLQVYGTIGAVTGAGTIAVPSGYTATIDSIDATTGLSGAGAITFTTMPPAAASRSTTGWTGTVTLTATNGVVEKLDQVLNGLGGVNATVIVNNIGQNSSGTRTFFNGSPTINPKISLVGAVYIANGTSNSTTTFKDLSGSGTLANVWNAGAMTFKINKLHDFTGSLLVTSGNASSKIVVDEIDVATLPDNGEKLLNTTTTNKVSITKIKVGDAAAMDCWTTAKADGLYIYYAAKLTVDGVTTIYGDLTSAVTAAKAAGRDVSEIDVMDETAAAPEGYEIREGKLVPIGGTTYVRDGAATDHSWTAAETWLSTNGTDKLTWANASASHACYAEIDAAKVGEIDIAAGTVVTATLITVTGTSTDGFTFGGTGALYGKIVATNLTGSILNPTILIHDAIELGDNAVLTFSAAEGETFTTTNRYTVTGGSAQKTGAGEVIIAGAGDWTTPIEVAEGALVFDVPEGVTNVVRTTISGAGKVVKRGKGCLMFWVTNTFTGGLYVEEGEQRTNTKQGFGTPNTAKNTIFVSEGATLDVANAANICYSIASAGTLYSSTQDIGVGAMQMTVLTLTGDTTVTGTRQFGLLGQGYGATTLTLGDHTLTKTGSGKFLLCNTTVSGTGTIDVQEGTLYCYNKGSAASSATLKLGASATVDLGAALAVSNLTVDAGASFTGSGTLTVNGALILPGDGDVTIPSQVTLGANGKIVLADGGTLVLTATADTEELRTVCMTGSDKVTLMKTDGSAAYPTAIYRNGEYITVYRTDVVNIRFNPVTSEPVAFTYRFNDATADGDWRTIGNWQQTSSGGTAWETFSGTGAPGIRDSGSSGPTLFEIKSAAISDVSPYLDGWNAVYGAYSNATVNIGHLYGFTNGGTVTNMWMVDETSHIRINGPDTNYGNVRNAAFYVAASNGLEFVSSYHVDANIYYYFKGEGTVTYTNITSGTHTILKADMKIGTEADGGKGVVEKLLVSFTSCSQNFVLSGATVNVSDRTDVTPVESVNTALAGDEDLGTWKLVQKTDGVYLDYIGYSPSVKVLPTFTADESTVSWNDASKWNVSPVPTSGDVLVHATTDTTISVPSAYSYDSVRVYGDGKATFATGASLTAAQITVDNDTSTGSGPSFPKVVIGANGSFTVTSTAFTFADNGVSGAGALVLDTGSGTTYTMSTGNSGYTGEAYVKSGTVKLGGILSFGPKGRSASVHVMDGATIDENGVSNGGDTGVNNKLVLEGGATLTNSGNSYGDLKMMPFYHMTLEGDANVIAPSGKTMGLSRHYNNPSFVYLNDNTLTKTGAGTFYLSAPTIYGAGTIDVTEGIIRLSRDYSSSNIQPTMADGTMYIRSGATLYLDDYNGGANLTVKNLGFYGTPSFNGTSTVKVTGTLTLGTDFPAVTLGAGATIEADTNGMVSVTGVTTLQGNVTFDSSKGGTTYLASVAGTGNIDVASGTLLLGDWQSHSGTVTIEKTGNLGLVALTQYDGEITLNTNRFVMADYNAVKVWNESLSATNAYQLVVNDDNTVTYKFSALAEAEYDYTFTYATSFETTPNRTTPSECNDSAGKAVYIQNWGTGRPSGMLKIDQSHVSSFDINTALDATTGYLAARTTPYTDNGITYADTFTAAVCGNLPSTANTVLVSFGTYYGGFLAIVRGDRANDVKLVWGNNNGVTTLAQTRVKNAVLTKHLYVFVRTADKYKIYVDDMENPLTSVDRGTYTIGGQLQVGSVHGGLVGLGLSYISPTDPALIRMVRVYQKQLGTKALTRLAEDFPAEDIQRWSRRTLAADSLTNLWYEAGKANWEVSTNHVDWTAAELPLEGSDVTITTEGQLAHQLQVVLNAGNNQTNTLGIGDLVIEGTAPLAVTHSNGGGYVDVGGSFSNAVNLVLDKEAFYITYAPLSLADDVTLKLDLTQYVHNELNIATATDIAVTGTSKEYRDGYDNWRVTGLFDTDAATRVTLATPYVRYGTSDQRWYIHTTGARDPGVVWCRPNAEEDTFTGSPVYDALGGEAYLYDDDTLAIYTNEYPNVQLTIADDVTMAGLIVPETATVILTNAMDDVKVYSNGTVRAVGFNPGASSTMVDSLHEIDGWQGVFAVVSNNFGNTRLDRFLSRASTLALDGCTVADAGGIESGGTLRLDNAGLTIKSSAGSAKTYYFGTLIGEGALIYEGTNTATNADVWRFKNAADFAGTISNAAVKATAEGDPAWGITTVIGSAYTGELTNGVSRLVVESDGTLGLAKSLYAADGITVAGALNILSDSGRVLSSCVFTNGTLRYTAPARFPLFEAPVTVAEGTKIKLDLSEVDLAGLSEFDLLRATEKSYLDGVKTTDIVAPVGFTVVKKIFPDSHWGFALRRRGFYLKVR